MYRIAEVGERIRQIKKRRAEHDNGHVILCAERTKIYTDYYKNHEFEVEALKRAGALCDWCAKKTLSLEEDAMFVGNIGREWRAACNYIEWGTGWIEAVIEQPEETFIRDWGSDGALCRITPEDKEIYKEAVGYWRDRTINARVLNLLPDEFWELKGDNCTTFGNRDKSMTANMPQGHFCTNYKKVIDCGWGYIRDEARKHMASIRGKTYADNAGKNVMWRCCELTAQGAILLTARYAEYVEQKSNEAEGARKDELQEMARSLKKISEKPAETYWEAMQMIIIYQLLLHADAQAHGVTLGRIDQYCGHFLEREMAAGTLTAERAQELTDAFILKLGDFFVQFYGFVLPKEPQPPKPTYHYECGGHHFTVGGQTRDGRDATNAMTLMLLQTYTRLYLTIPSCSVRIHKNTPSEVWEYAIESSKAAGGMPTFENDEIIIGALMERGMTKEDANDYCIIGCVEPAGCGNEWSACGSSGGESFSNLVGIMNMAIHNGNNPKTGNSVGLKTGYLYDYKSFEEFKSAFLDQMYYFLDWHISYVNYYELIYSTYFPSVAASATMEGCMESGKDATAGGARYNSTGFTALGVGNVADSLMAIKKLVFDDKLVTAHELYEALINNWSGYEELQRYIVNVLPHYGNGISEVDEIGAWVLDAYADHMNSCTGPRGKWRGGTFTVTTHLEFGELTIATPDGRNDGDPLAEAISPRQGFDKNGPTAYLLSAAKLPHYKLGNGDMLNIRFSPATVRGEDGADKLRHLLETYFEQGGMQVQFNVVATETLYDAQKNPDDYKDLIVRIAGFSVYFVEISKVLQDDFITRTEHMV